MKKLLLALLGLLTLQSCYDPGKIQVQNNISNVRIQDVYWGDIYLAGELLPGQTGEERELQKRDEELPSSHRVTFVMTANQKTIYLQTNSSYYLDEGGHLLIELNDDTPVSNPN